MSYSMNGSESSLFPSEIAATKAELDSRFYKARITGKKNDRLQCIISIPEPCYHSDAPPGTVKQRGPFIALSHFERTGCPELQFTISYCELSREVGAAEWTQIEIERSGGRLIQQRDVYGPGGWVSDILSQTVIDDRRFVSRHMMVKDGSRLFWVEGIAPIRDYLDVAKDIFVSLQSFRLLQSERLNTAEPLEQFSLDVPFKTYFEHPSSWEVQQEGAIQNGCSLSLKTSDEELVHSIENWPAGEIGVTICRRGSDRTAAQIARGYAQGLQNRGIRIGGAPVLPIQPPLQFESAGLFLPSATYENTALDAPLIIFINSEVEISLSMVGPSRETSPEWWAINKRAFEIVRDSLSVSK